MVLQSDRSKLLLKFCYEQILNYHVISIEVAVLCVAPENVHTHFKNLVAY